MSGTKRVSCVNLALIGFGGVARRFVELLGEQRQVLKARHGLRWKIVGIPTATRGTALAPAGVDPEQFPIVDINVQQDGQEQHSGVDTSVLRGEF